ncbi:MAG TPA: pyrroline-5-carboxylate reductase [Gammaproteobacteria bacterium]|nr:pyrroline-5-carboxylate reductase [Gammaproteobacteria bacterium]
MRERTIAFVGGGNMARSLIGGLIKDGCRAERLWVSDPDPAKLDRYARHYTVHTSADNKTPVEHADVVVLAVKPQVLKTVAQDLAAAVAARKPLVISIAAGIRESDLRRWLGEGIAIVRTMPNTPALVGSGASALYANAYVDAEQRDLAESILRAAGVTLWVDDEAQMDTVTALSGSGPAYFFLVMEALEQAAVRHGLPPASAHLLTLQTAYGAAKMALESPEELGALRRRVTSPGGTTERAIQVLQDSKLEALFERALAAAEQRSKELATLFGEN